MAQVGKVDEIFGAIKDVHFSVKMSEGMVASSFNSDQKFFINPEKLLPLARFLPKPPAPKGVAKKGAGGAARGGRGGARGGRMLLSFFLFVGIVFALFRIASTHVCSPQPCVVLAACLYSSPRGVNAPFPRTSGVVRALSACILLCAVNVLHSMSSCIP